MSDNQSLLTPLSPNGQEAAQIPDPEVVVKLKRRAFTNEYKLRIVDEADQCQRASEVGALLRREGLYSSHLTAWRRQQARGELRSPTAKKRGRQPDAQAVEIARLRQENERLRTRLAQAETILEVQKKLSQVLGPTPTVSDDST